MPHRASKLERTACEQLRALLEDPKSEVELGTSSSEAGLMTSLEYLGRVLAESTWAQDQTTDGSVGHFCERIGTQRSVTSAALTVRALAHADDRT